MPKCWNDLLVKENSKSQNLKKYLCLMFEVHVSNLKDLQFNFFIVILILLFLFMVNILMKMTLCLKFICLYKNFETKHQHILYLNTNNDHKDGSLLTFQHNFVTFIIITQLLILQSIFSYNFHIIN